MIRPFESLLLLLDEFCNLLVSVQPRCKRETHQRDLVAIQRQFNRVPNLFWEIYCDVLLALNHLLLFFF